jgi:DNA polymerase-3 subunit epsilon
VDTLALARNKHPGQRNNLDALCKRYMVDNSQRDLHGALLDSEILADVYLIMTGGQVNLNINDQPSADDGAVSNSSGIRRLPADRPALKVIKASDAELASHNKKLEAIKSASGHCVWQDISQ